MDSHHKLESPRILNTCSKVFMDCRSIFRVRADRSREWPAFLFRMMRVHPSLLLSLSEPGRKAFATLQKVVHNLSLNSTWELKYTCLRTNTAFWLTFYKSMSKTFGSFNGKDLYLGYEGSLSLSPTYTLFQVSLSYWGNTCQSHPWTGFLIMLFRPAAKIRVYPFTPCLWSMLFIINAL